MMKKQFTAFLLLIAMLAASACGGTSGATDTTAADGTTAPAETEPEDTYVYDDLPDKDFGGAEWNILTTTWYSAPNYIYAETQNGDVMNDALYSARINTEDRFNVAIKLTANEDASPLAVTIHNIVLSGDDTYHLFYSHDTKTVGNAFSGDFLDLRSALDVNFDKPWWKGATESFTIAGKLLFTSNCFSLGNIFMNYVLAFNKEMADANNVKIPYDKVTAGQWYLDDLISLTKDVARDIDGDSDIDENDQYGFVTSYYGNMGMQSDLGGAAIVTGANGELKFNDNTERMVGLMEKVETLMKAGTSKYGKSNEFGVELFVDHKALFMFGESRVLYSHVRDSDVTYGIMPFPKYDSTQKEYASSGCDLYWAIPKTAKDLDMTSVIMEALSCYNYNNVVPKVWELVLGRKLADSQEDTDMFNIIRDVQYVDLGFAFSFQSTELSETVFLLEKTTSDQAASFIASRKTAVEEAIEKINAYYRDYE